MSQVCERRGEAGHEGHAIHAIDELPNIRIRRVERRIDTEQRSRTEQQRDQWCDERDKR
jgi:hypothetical protein